MGDLIDDEMLDAFAVVGEPEEVGAELNRRYGDVAQRVELLRPVRERSRALAGRDRQHQERVTHPRSERVSEV